MQKLQNIISGINQVADLPLVLATIWTINNTYAKFSISPLTFGEYANSLQQSLYHYDMMEAILLGAERYRKTYGGSKNKICLESYNRWTPPPSTDIVLIESRFDGIWLLDSLKAFDGLEADLLNAEKNYLRNGYYCIVYTGTESRRLFNIREIFERLFSIYVVNVNVFLECNKTVEIYTYFPYAFNDCNSYTPKLVATLTDLNRHKPFSTHFKLFPPKANNLYGCHLKLISWTHPPYMYVELDPVTNDLKQLHGIEGLLVSLLANRLNFTIKMLITESADRGIIYANGTATGASKLIIDGEANLTIGAFMYEKNRAEAMFASHSYITGLINIAIPQGQPLSPFERLIKPFTYIMWTCVSSTLLIGIVVIYVLKLMCQQNMRIYVFGYDNRTPFTNLLNTLLGGSVHNKPRQPRYMFTRCLLSIWLLYTLVLRNAYISELYIILQDGRGRTPVNSIAEAVAKNYTFFTVPIMARVLKSAFSSASVYISPNGSIGQYKILPLLAITEKKLAATLLQHTIQIYNHEQRQTRKFVNTIKKPFMAMPIALFMRKHSYLKLPFDHVIKNAMSAGILKCYENLYLSNIKYNEQHEPVVISIWLLFGLFTICGILLLFATFVFMLELLTQKSTKLRKFLDFVNC